MYKIEFYGVAGDEDFPYKFAVISARYGKNRIFCRHKSGGKMSST